MLRKLYLTIALFIASLFANPWRVRLAILAVILALAVVAALVPSVAIMAGEASGGSH